MLIAYQDFNFSDRRMALIDTANSIIREYTDGGYILTLRQLYYQFVARGIIENSERSYKNLGNCIADGRLAGLISWEAIEDRARNVTEWLINEDEQETLYGLDRRFALDHWARQNVYVEVWVEKEALAAVVERPCSRMSVPFLACKGYLSASEAWRAGRRFLEKLNEGRRCVMIHLGDHDPSGIDMTRDNSDRLALFGESGEIEVRRIALNMDQVEQYNPPPNPAKITDSRADAYIERFGRTSYELDALDPRSLDKLITTEIESLIDPDIWTESHREQRQRRKVLKSFYERFGELSQYIMDTEMGEDDDG